MLKKSRHYIDRANNERSYLTDEIVEYVLANYEKKTVQSNGRIVYWAFVESLSSFLRVVTESDGEIVTA